MVKPETPQGPLAVFLESQKYTVVEAETVEIPVVIINLGEAADSFEVGTAGVPTAWVTLPAPPVIPLEKSETKRIVVRVTPSQSVGSISGDYQLKLTFTSQQAANISKEVEVTLTVSDAKEAGQVALLAEQTQFEMAPGTRATIPFSIHNQGESSGFFEVTIVGLPASWFSLPTAVAQVGAGQMYPMTLEVQLPPAPQIQAGTSTFKIHVVNQANRANFAEREFQLVVAAFTAHGRVGVMVNSVQFSVAPGSRVSIPLVLLNQGTEPDNFGLSVDGIPVGWVSTNTPVVPLGRGEQKEVSLSIAPPRAPESRAGRHEFTLRVTSQLAPEQPVEIDCILSVAAFTDFQCTLSPVQINSGEVATLLVENEGNASQAFAVTWTTPADSLLAEVQQSITAVPGQAAGSSAPPAFVAAEKINLRVPAGQQASINFRLRERNKAIFGGAATVPFTINIESTGKKVQRVDGQVITRPLIPAWALVVVALFCGLLFIASYFAFRYPAIVAGQQTAAADSATQTAAAGGVQTATAVAGMLQTGTAVFATQTAAVGSLQTATAAFGSQTAIADMQQTATSIFATATAATAGQQTAVAGFATQTSVASALQTATAAAQPPTLTPTPPTPTSPSINFHGTMVFSSNRDASNYQLYSATGPNGAGILRLTFSSGYDVYARYSPDGTRIAFTSNRDGNYEIYVMNSDGSNVRNLTNNPATDQFPTWSPDGQSIAFMSDRDGNQEIYVMQQDGQNPKNLTNSPTSNDTLPFWGNLGGFVSPRLAILFTSNRSGNSDIFSMNPDGSNVVNLTLNPANDYAAVVSVDGKIAFTSERDGNPEVYIMNSDGTGQTNLTLNGASDSYPIFSPDGGWIAFNSNRTGNADIFIMRSNGTDVYDFTNNPATDFLATWR